MKKFIFVIFAALICCCHAEGPFFRHKEPEKQQEFENIYQDIRRLSSKSSIFYNVKDYGAKGDGVTDDSSAVQALNNLIVSSAYPGTIFFPSGTYKFTSGINIDMSYCSVLSANAKLDFSSLTSGSAITLGGNINNTYFGNPYLNADKYLANFTLIGPAYTTNVKGLRFYSATEPGPSHTKTYNVNIQGFQTAISIEDNAYILNFYGTEVFVSSVCVNVANATNSGEKIYFNGGAFYNSETGFKLDNGNATLYIEGVSVDGMSGTYYLVNAGDIHISKTHNEGYFDSHGKGRRIFWVPTNATGSVYAYISDSYFTIKSTRTAAAFDINKTCYFHLINSHVNGVGTASAPIVLSTYSAVSFIFVDGVTNTTSDTLVTISTNTTYWRNDDSANTVVSNRPIQMAGTKTNDSASTGDVGEYISASVSQGSAVTCTNGQYGDVTSIIVSSGDWDVEGIVGFTGGAITGTQFCAGIGTASGNSASGLTSGTTFIQSPTAPTASSDASTPVNRVRISVASNTTLYLKWYTSFTVGTLKAYGSITARRPR